MKITKCGDCPKAEPKFDPATAKNGTLMRDCCGSLCVRTNKDWGERGCDVYLFSDGTIYVGRGTSAPYTRVPTGEKYLIEQTGD